MSEGEGGGVECDDACQEQEELVARLVIIMAEVFLLVLLVITYFLSTSKIMEKVSVYAPHSTWMILLGIILGLIVQPIDKAIHHNLFKFENEFFFAVLLPPIILGAGFSVRKDHFFHNFGSILVLAFVGTAISTGVIGGLMYAVGGSAGIYQFGDINDYFILGSLISAVDPIATVVVLKSLGVDPHLYVLIFGESVLNDAVAIVINRVFVGIREGKDSNPGVVVGLIIASAIGSITIGLVFGFLGAYVHKVSDLKLAPTLEIGFFFLIAIMPYEIAELCGLSGIMAILFTGIVADHYTSWNLSHHGATACREMVEVFAFICESFVFVYLGMTIFTFHGHVLEVPFIGILLVFCLVGRLAAVFPLSLLLNCGRKHKIPGKHMLVIWFAGLRGPIAFALALASPEDERGVMVTSTLGIVLITTIVFGGATMPILSRLKLTVDGDEEEEEPGKPGVHGNTKAKAKEMEVVESLSVHRQSGDYRPRVSVATASALQRSEVMDDIEKRSMYALHSTLGHIDIDARSHRDSHDQKYNESMHWFARLHVKYLAPMFRSPIEDSNGSEHVRGNAQHKASQDLAGIEMVEHKVPVNEPVQEQSSKNLLEVPGQNQGNNVVRDLSEEDDDYQPHSI